MANQIKFGMKFDVDKSGLNELKNELQAIQKITEQDLLKINPGTSFQDAKTQLVQIKQSAGEIQQALNRAFSRELGTVNITKFNNELKKIDINKIYKDLSLVGTAGKTAFRDTATEVLTTNMQLKQTHKLLDDMATSMANTVKWGITSSIFNNITGSIQKAWTYTKSLDTSLNDIRIVTDKSADSMAEFAVQANKAAKELGASTRDYTDASLIYYQQGLSDEETRARTETTLKAANVTGQRSEEVSEQLTAIWNGYKVSADEAELYIDKVAAVAAATAADLEELSTGMGKVASAANTMGVNVDQMNALLATAVSVTREAPETIGTSFRSIFSRMGQLKSDGTDEFGVTLGKVTTQLQSMGIEILDQQGNMRDMGTVITEVGEKWQGWTQAQKVAAAQAMAGTQQYSRLMAVFENWDMYEDALETSMDASGTLESQQATYMESMAAHQQQLSTSIERVYDSLFNADSFEKVLDTLTWITDRVGDLIDGLGGGGNAFLALGSIAMKVFDTQISRGIATTISNINALKENTNKLSAQMETIKLFEGKDINDEYFQTLVKMKEEVLSYGDIVSEIEHNQANDIIKATNSLQNQADAWKENLEEIDKYLLQFETLKEYTLDIPVVSTKKDEKGQEYQVTETQETFQLENIDATSDRYKGIIQALEETETEMKKATAETKDYDKVLKKLVSTVDKVSLASEDAGVNLEGFTEAEKEEIQVFNELKGVANKYIETAKDVQSLDATSVNQKLELANAINEYNRALESGDTLAVAEKVNNLSNIIKKVAGEVTSTATNTKKHIEKEANGESAHLKGEIDEVKKKWSDFIKNLSLVQKINAFTKIVSGIGQIISGITSLINLIDVWNNQELTFGEKLSQTLTTLAFVLPSLVNGFTGLSAALALVGITFKSTAAKGATLGVVMKATTITIGKTTIALSKFLIVAGAIIAVAALIGVAINAWQKEQNKLNQAVDDAKKRAKELAEAYKEVKEAYNKLKSDFDNYKSMKNALNDLVEGTNEWKEKLEEINSIVLDLIQTYPELAAYLEQDKETGALSISQEGLDTIEKKESRKVTSAAVQNLQGQAQVYFAERNREIGNFDKETKFLDKNVKSESERRELLAKFATRAYENRAIALNGSDEQRIDLFKDLIPESMSNEELIKALNENSQELIRLGGSLNSYSGSIGQYSNSIAAVVGQEFEFYQNSQNKDLINEYAGKFYQDKYSEEFSNIENASNKEIAEQYSLLFNKGGSVKYYTFQNKISYTDENGDTVSLTYDEAKEKIATKRTEDATRSEVINATGETDQIVRNLNNYESSGLGNFISALSQGEDVTQQYTKEEIQQYQDLWTQYLQIADSTEKEIIAKYMNVDEVSQQIANVEQKSKTSDEFIKERQENFKKNNAGLVDSATSLQEGIASGDITAENALENESFKQLYNQLDSLKQAYPEITNAANMLKETWAIGTEEYAEALEEVQDKLYKIETTALDDTVDEARTTLKKFLENTDFNVEMALDDENFEKALDDYLNAEYQIDVRIHMEAEQEFNRLSESINTMHEKATLIGDDFIISADNVRELNNTFPGIIQNMKDMGNGTIQLNKEAVQSSITAAQAEIASDSEATLTKLNNQAILLRGKEKTYLSMAEAAGKLAQSEELTEEESADAKAQINAGLTELENINNELRTTQEIDNNKTVADSSNTNAGIVAQNWDEAYKSAAQSSYDFAQAAIKNNIAAVEQDLSKTTKGNFRITYAGKAGENAEATLLEDTKKEIDAEATENSKERWAELQKQFESLAANAGRQATDIEGMMAQIGAYNNKTNFVFGNIKKGLGEDGKKDNEDKQAEPDKKDPLKEQINRYHDINIELDQIDDSLNRLEKENEKLFGADLINNLNEQYKLLNQEIDATAKKTEIVIEEMQELQEELSGKGVAFSDDGTISNYENALKAQENYVNFLIGKYNNMTAEEQEAFKETVERAEEDFETFKDNLERYDEIITGELPELAEKTQEALDQQIEISIEKFNMEIETRLDMSQAERDWNEFKKKIIDGIDDDDILGNAKANLEDFSSYYKDNFEGVIQVNTDHVNDILFELSEMDKGLASKYYGDNRAKALEDLKTYYSQLMDDLSAVEDLSEKIRQSYLDMMDEAQEKFDEQISTYEQIADLIDHDMKLIELLGGEKSYEAFGEYYNKLEVNNNKQLDFQRQQVEFWKAQMDSAEEGSERWQKAKENWTAAVTDWRDLVNSSIENLQDKYLNTISSIFEELNKKVTNELGLEYVNEQWGLINRNAEEYLDTINAMYGIQELSNKYLDAIDQTDSISAQRELNKLMEQEIATLEEKDKLTQYDIDRANMRYDIALKQIALEEAQQNKTSMRLKRDSQGNYSYQFVADEDAVGAAEDELAAAQNELYNFDKENYINNLDELYAAYEEYQEKMFEAAQINDPDERLQREALLNEQYGELINGLVEQNQTIRSNLHESAFDELARLYNTDVENYRKMSEEERNVLLNEMIPQWTSGVQQMADTFAGEGGLGEVCKESLAEISQATEDYKDDLEEVEEAAGLTFEEIVDGTDDTITETEDLLEINDELIDQYEDELDAIDAVIDELDKLIERFKDAKQAAIDASKAAYEYAQKADDNMSDEAFEDRDYSEDMTRAIVSGYSTSDEYYQSLAKRRDKKIAESDVQTDVTSSRLKKLFDAYRAGDPKAKTVVMAVYNGEADYTDKFLDEYGFKTGGYTGNWTGETGKLAFLHQKELVLNAEDTQNVLGAVKILRNITDLIGNSVVRKAAAMSENIATPQGGNITNETLEQDVHIDAHFPNVTNSREIENALDNLMNKASQRALRKK